MTEKPKPIADIVIRTLPVETAVECHCLPGVDTNILTKTMSEFGNFRYVPKLGCWMLSISESYEPRKVIAWLAQELGAVVKEWNGTPQQPCEGTGYHPNEQRTPTYTRIAGISWGPIELQVERAEGQPVPTIGFIGEYKAPIPPACPVMVYDESNNLVPCACPECCPEPAPFAPSDEEVNAARKQAINTLAEAREDAYTAGRAADAARFDGEIERVKRMTLEQLLEWLRSEGGVG